MEFANGLVVNEANVRMNLLAHLCPLLPTYVHFCFNLPTFASTHNMLIWDHKTYT